MLTPAERRLLIVLVLGFLLAWGVDELARRRPERLRPWVGADRLEDLLAAGGESPAGPPGPGPAPSARPAVVEASGARLPYDRRGRLDLNAADSSDLVLLDGVGPVLAGRILAQRRRNGDFRRPEDLLPVRGIGPRTLAKLLPQLVLGAAKDSLSGAAGSP